MKKTKLIIGAVVILIFSIFFYSFRLTTVPSGTTTDEPSIGYNAILISQTLRDETGRFLPIFPLTLNKTNWKQPVSVYATAVFFKIFGASYFNLRLVNVLVAIVSLFLIMYLNFLLFGQIGAFVAALLVILTPTVLMHSHLAQENIMPIPFVTAWLIFITLYKKSTRPIFLILSGIAMGIGIYSYKGMRGLTPPLIIISVLYLYLTSKNKIKSALLFILGLAPFLLVMPWINIHYAGALFDNQGLTLLKYYDFFYPYLSSFDLTGLFIKGDITPWHSTGFHGVFLLSTIPIFILGLVLSSKEKKYDHFLLFMLISFFAAPLLYGQVGSVYRFSRLLIFVPFYVTFCTLSILNIIKIKRGLLIVSVIGILVFLNFADFLNYYWYTYPVIHRQDFSDNTDGDFLRLSQIAKEKDLLPFIYSEDYNSQGDNARFFEASYFDKKLGQWKPGDALPSNSILMTKLGTQPGMKEYASNQSGYRYLVNTDFSLP